MTWVYYYEILDCGTIGKICCHLWLEKPRFLKQEVKTANGLEETTLRQYQIPLSKDILDLDSIYIFVLQYIKYK